MTLGLQSMLTGRPGLSTISRTHVGPFSQCNECTHAPAQALTAMVRVAHHAHPHAQRGLVRCMRVKRRTAITGGACVRVCVRVRLRACLRRTWSWGAATWLPSQSAALTCTHMLCVHTQGGQHRAGNIAEQKRGTAMCELVVAAGVKFEVLRLVRPRVATTHPTRLRLTSHAHIAFIATLRPLRQAVATRKGCQTTRTLLQVPWRTPQRQRRRHPSCVYELLREVVRWLASREHCQRLSWPQEFPDHLRTRSNVTVRESFSAFKRSIASNLLAARCRRMSHPMLPSKLWPRPSR
jgi:hypothetical protein